MSRSFVPIKKLDFEYFQNYKDSIFSIDPYNFGRFLVDNLKPYKKTPKILRIDRKNWLIISVQNQ